MKGFTYYRQEPNSWFINHHQLIWKLISKKRSFQKCTHEGFINPTWAGRHMQFNIRGGLSPMTSESLGFHENNEGRSQTITMLKDPIRTHLT